MRSGGFSKGGWGRAGAVDGMLPHPLVVAGDVLLPPPLPAKPLEPG